jgi:hypothetical protein
MGIKLGLPPNRLGMMPGFLEVTRAGGGKTRDTF